ncbi:unnamed protein product [Bursaphelenchus xylophilus]|uniref:(pine wood nematode) hypothetical protein n=1 Tax=Bursaphelenchus xylophilus TaxID=6326 RepID=A0A1I7SV83_BURXY|nr:unnamed protein product [Bursaphelenchus xylophilus]CAG9101050.1 unnamed protein product [Bursaphelenchus xylophilus]
MKQSVDCLLEWVAPGGSQTRSPPKKAMICILGDWGICERVHGGNALRLKELECYDGRGHYPAENVAWLPVSRVHLTTLVLKDIHLSYCGRQLKAYGSCEGAPSYQRATSIITA